MPPRTADELRRAWLDFFAARGHTVVPSASLIPHDPTMLLTTAGMVQFKPFMLGDEPAPYSRAVTVQKCFRTTDVELVGTTARHLTFFEMLGNFSLGDYFVDEAIPWSWELSTEVLGLDPDRIWVTIFESDDESFELWHRTVGLPADRIQRLGIEDNFWAMGPTGPCGPCSELHYDRGPEYGPEGGPAVSSERFVEYWNLVFMRLNRDADGTLHDLPRRNIDTGAGLDRILALLQGTTSVFETDVLRAMVAAAETLTGRTYGADPRADVSLRILGDHGRAFTFLVADGVRPSNEERGYVLRRIIRRAIRHAYLLGTTDDVTAALVDACVETMGGHYTELVGARDEIVAVVGREEARFRETLRRGLDLLDEILERGDVSGADAFRLHDTLGFPIDLTAELAAERGRAVDVDGFRAHMEDQRDRARRSARSGTTGAPLTLYRELLETFGPTEFTGRREHETRGAKVLALAAPAPAEPEDAADAGVTRLAGTGTARQVDAFLDRTPCYAESGGQVGDTGTIESADGSAVLRVLDTRYALPGQLVVHRCEVLRGELHESDEVVVRIDAPRRDRIRRNHTATHILHWALREVLGPHVKQAGSLVAPDRLRFDFSHHAAVTPEELDAVERLANEEIITDAPVRHYETTKEEAERLGAIAFFGDKYGDLVRVLEAGEHSLELCGGTHVHALGFIGPIKIVSESSIGSSLRRIEAVTGDAALDRIHDEELQLRAAAAALRVGPAELASRVEQLAARVKELGDELAQARAERAAGEAGALAASAEGGVVAARRDGLDPDALRILATASREALGHGIVVLVGASADGAKANLAVAVSGDLVAAGVSAAELAQPAARLVQGGTNRSPDLAVGGGRQPGALDAALAAGRDAARAALTGLGPPDGAGAPDAAGEPPVTAAPA